MKEGIWQQIKTFVNNFLRSLYQLRNGELLTFLIFLIIATFIWFLQSTQSLTQSTISFPIRYKELPGNITVSNQLQENVQVTVQDKGSRLYAYHFKRKKLALEVDLMALKTGEGIVSVPMKQFESKIYAKLKPGSNILRIQPDSLLVYFVANESKKIPVTLASDINPAAQHMITGDIEISPAIVEAYAPMAVLDSIRMVKTQLLTLKDLKDTTYYRLSLETVDGVRFSHQEIDVMVPIEPFTECSMEVPVHGFLFPEGQSLRSFPSKVNISFLIPESLYPSMKAEDFLIGVDYEELRQQPNGLVEPRILEAPQTAKRILIKPQQVDCLIEKL